MAPGTSQTTLMVRAYSVLLQSPAQLDTDDSCRDPYWSLVGYFNSLRVLGGAKMQVFDDIPAYMEVIARRLEGEPRPVTKVIELTSREPDAEIPDHLKELDIRLGEGPVLPLDVILATNMISVGVDIDRLGLMAVMGQPQSASEYIQATSRVGRRHPGLIAVLFNAARSRDLSHYEGFHGFHSALYREVNPSSVTPFSARARDRGLHAVLVALCRHTVPGLRENKDAGAVAGYAEDLARIRKRILARVRSVKPDEVDECAAHLDQIIQDWTERAARDQGLVYNNPSWEDEDIDAGLLIGAEGSEPEAGRFPTLWSLRDVDTQTNLYSVKG